MRKAGIPKTRFLLIDQNRKARKITKTPNSIEAVVVIKKEEEEEEEEEERRQVKPTE